MWSFIIRAFAAFLFCAAVVSWYFIPDSFFIEYSDAIVEFPEEERGVVEEVVMKDVGEEIIEVEDNIKESVKQSVPFIVQAPHAQWDDARYQDACEEASMIMVDGWLKGEWHISKNDAEEVMEDMFSREGEMFDGAIDTSAVDTAHFFTEYYGHTAEVRKNITLDQLYRILSDGYVVIAPTNGKMLENPNFTNGGPERHMLVIVGYDRDNREFITNDPGTRVGRGYKYKDAVLYNAIRDYETGAKKEITGSSKNIIVVKK